MKSTKSLTAALEVFVVLLAVSAMHRLLAFAPLAGSLPLASEEGLRALGIGFLSDIWICYLVAFLCFVVDMGLSFAGWPNAARLAVLGLLTTLSFGAAVHQSYVEFFHFQIIPFHLRYIFDSEFVSANFASMINWRSVVIAATFFVCGAIVLKVDAFSSWTLKRATSTFGVLTLLALGAHNRNIHYRVQWFVPENLQVNALERLYLHAKVARLPAPLSGPELSGLASMLKSDLRGSNPFSSPMSPPQFFQLLTKPTADTAPKPIAIAMRGAFSTALQAKAKPIVMTVLLESLRPSETGYFAPASGPSLTPTLDQAAASGIVFTHAYSTGSVTRGAQEAAFCGYLGSRDTSLMRGEAIAQLNCLPDMLRAERTAVGARGVSFWYHGGDERFDNQVAYWRIHGVREIMSLKDFSPDTPRTGWGIGDKAYFTAAAKRLIDFHDSSEADFLVGMGLSVTNHIPWELPSDAGAESNTPRAQVHPSYRTTAYTDAALGEFIAALKSSGLWKNTLLILASDHGTKLPPLVDLYPGRPEAARLLESHINLIVTGGLTDTALASQGVSSLRVDDVVSQADIAAFVGYVVDLPGARFMGQNLLRQERALPVLSDLEEDLFDPETGHQFSRSDVVSENPDSLAPLDRKALLYYRAFLQYIYAAPVGHE